MYTQPSSPKISELTNKIIEKVMMTMGVFAYVWILAILLVGMIDK